VDDDFSTMELKKNTNNMYFSDICCFGFPVFSKTQFNKTYVRTLSAGGTSILVDRKIIDQFGYVYEPDFIHYCADTDLGLRANVSEFEVVMVPEAIIYHMDTGKKHTDFRLFYRYFNGLKDRLIAFFISMYLIEWLIALPVLTLGIPLNAFNIRLNRFKSTIIFI